RHRHIRHYPTRRSSDLKKQTRRQTVTNAERLKSYNELKAGDYVVHANHGIGKYIGMETLEVDGVHQDYMTILYQNDDKLFIPVRSEEHTSELQSRFDLV